MATQRATDTADIRRRIEEWANALRAMDLERVMSIYAPDIVSFDIVPPLQYVGVEKRKPWMAVFAMYQPPLDYENRNLTITLSDDVAFSHCFNRISGTLKNGGRTAGYWVRWTACFRKIDGNWLIAHEQVSVPVDVESGRALLNLEP